MNPAEIRAFLEKLFKTKLSPEALANLERAGETPEGMVRMFRGSQAPDRTQGAGQMFTRDIRAAGGFAKQFPDPTVSMVDVPEHVAERGRLTSKGITKLSGAEGTRTSPETDAERASFIVSHYAMDKKKIFPAIAGAILTGKLTDDMLAPSSRQVTLPTSEEMIKTTPGQDNYGVPRESNASPRTGLLAWLQDKVYGSEPGRRLMEATDWTNENIDPGNLGNFTLAGGGMMGIPEELLGASTAKKVAGAKPGILKSVLNKAGQGEARLPEFAEFGRGVPKSAMSEVESEAALRAKNLEEMKALEAAKASMKPTSPNFARASGPAERGTPADAAWIAKQRAAAMEKASVPMVHSPQFGKKVPEPVANAFEGPVAPPHEPLAKPDAGKPNPSDIDKMVNATMRSYLLKKAKWLGPAAIGYKLYDALFGEDYGQ